MSESSLDDVSDTSPNSSPLASTEESSDECTSNPPPSPPVASSSKRRKYDLYEPVVPLLETYWPPAANNNDVDHNLTETSSEESSSSEDEDDSEDEFSDGEQASDISSVYASDGSGNASDSGDDESCQEAIKVHDGTELTVDEGVLTIMDMFIKYKMEKVQMKGILMSVLKFLPKINNMPKTKHNLFKFIENLCPLSKEKVYFYCSVCHYYIGEQLALCHLCGNDPNKFYQLSLAEQLKSYFENHGLADVIDNYRASRQKEADGNSYSDICDGCEFKKVCADGYSLTLLGHTDGLSISDSSSACLWPCEFVFAEVPPHLRFKFILISGIWVDDCKPNMNTFLKPTVEELNVLSAQGVKWIHPQTEAEQVTRVKAPVMCADAPARAGIQNILAHGGKHCCNICEQKMKKLPREEVLPGVKKKARRRVYTYEERDLRLRSSDRMELQGRETRRKQAERGGPLTAVKGVRGSSVVSDIPGCDRSM
ncbi:Halomucin [Frankliniella fusca]|uniref:Halomucin n=1 Tax=Frankliniella fusca TaxID=407009 RepID=A0AAE1LUA6_9NEOP|nr:Halomucin [Frankliniella fusca]